MQAEQYIIVLNVFENLNEQIDVYLNSIVDKNYTDVDIRKGITLIVRCWMVDFFDNIELK